MDSAIELFRTLMLGRTLALEIESHGSIGLALTGVWIHSHTGRKCIGFAVKSA